MSPCHDAAGVTIAVSPLVHRSWATRRSTVPSTPAVRIGFGSRPRVPSPATLDTTPSTAPLADSPTSSFERSNPSRPCIATRAAPAERARRGCRRCVQSRAPAAGRTTAMPRHLRVEARPDVSIRTRSDGAWRSMVAAIVARSSLGSSSLTVSPCVRRSASTVCCRVLPSDRTSSDTAFAATLPNRGAIDLDLRRLPELGMTSAESFHAPARFERCGHLCPWRRRRQSPWKQRSHVSQAARGGV